MNPLTNVKNITKLSANDLGKKSSWHDQYSKSAWIFIGGLSYDLTEGDLICVFSEYGEVVAINLIRDGKTGKSKGFCFLCYEDQRSTTLAVDNFNGIKLASRTIRVDHVEQYKVPQVKESFDEERKRLMLEGCAPKSLPVKSEDSVPKSVPLPSLKQELPSKLIKDEKLKPDSPIREKYKREFPSKHVKDEKLRLDSPRRKKSRKHRSPSSSPEHHHKSSKKRHKSSKDDRENNNSKKKSRHR